MVTIKVINPSDSRQVSLKFQTYDNSGREIGISRSSTLYNALPLPLNATITKSSQQVSTLYNLTCAITLAQAVTTANTIEIVLPPSSYNLTAIVCIQGGVNLNCNKNIDSVGQLRITFVPPCSTCAAGTVISFAVSNLMNPAFINTANEQITVNTRSAQGTI